MTTGNDICEQALKKAGILGAGVQSEPEDIVDALADLNDMLAQWRRQRWLMFQLLDLSFVSTGAQYYTVGPAGNFVADPRPDRLETAYLRQVNVSSPNQVDFPLELIEARETYSRLALKSLVSFSQFIWYDTSYDTGRIYPWPIPQATIYEIHIVIKSSISEITSGATTLTIPAEYFAAMKFNLARRLRSAYRLPADAELNTLAQDALEIIRGANAQIPRLQVPGELARPGLYNIYSDQIY